MTSRLPRDPSKSDEEWARIEDQYKRDADRRGFGDIRPAPRPDLVGDRIWDRGEREAKDRWDTKWGGGRSPIISRPTRDLSRRLDPTRPGRRGGGFISDGGMAEVMGGGPEYWREGGGEKLGYGYSERPRERRGGGRRGSGRRGGWWNEPRRPEPRREYPTEFSDRLSSDSERMRLLTGEADPIKSPDSSRLLRDDYDPVDREFNRQFDEAPRGRQPWHSDPTGNPLERDPLSDYDSREGRSTRRTPARKDFSGFPPSGKTPKRNIKNRGEEEARIQPMPSPPSIPEPPKEPKYGRWQDAKLPIDGLPRDPRDTIGTRYGPDGSVTKINVAGPWRVNRDPVEKRRPDTDPVKENDAARTQLLQKYDDTDLKKRIAALEERGSIVTQPTQDLSGITGRLSELEGRKPDASWKDPLAAVQAGQTQGQEARSALDARLAALENYYKNDPPPKESVGNRYEDKYNQLNKLWEREGKAQKWGDDARKELGYRGKENWDYSYAGDQGQAWAGDLPEGYVQGIRNLNREYNKPIHEAIIKGREYKAYDPRAAARLRYLDQENIHEDTYLGRGDWDNKYGEKVYGRGKGDEARYFVSQSGLEKDSDEYTKRFSDRWGNIGKDYAWYK